MSEPTNAEISELWLAHRAYLVDLAFRMLGNIHDAEDVVQEAFGRLLPQELEAIDDVRGWLVVVVSRICLDQLRSARHRHEMNTGEIGDFDRGAATRGGDPADRVTLDDSIHMALLVVLQQLSPAERAVFVLHDIFQFSFDAVGSIVGRTPAACRQLASRARRRIEEESGPARFEPDVAAHHLVAQRFVEACAGGDLAALMELLDEDVGGDVDLGALGPPRAPLRGRRTIARNLLAMFGPRSGMTLVSQPVNGHPGLLAFRGKDLYGMVQMKTRDAMVYDLHAVADPAKLALVNLQLTRSNKA